MTDYEVELKFPISDPGGFLTQLQSLGAVQRKEVQQIDRYFSHPVRQFAQTDEAFRLRSEGDANCLTYKGPLLDRSTKTRQEIELDVAGGDEAAQRAWALLRALGFEDVYSVHKRRQTYTLNRDGREFSLAIDQVTDLGLYLEIETLADASTWEAARDAALRLAAELNLHDSERRSYLQLLLEQQGKN
ncbi:MAG: class IV adenylate cyclase [Planctomycetaceae bacterium]|nr:class IV adenylate cyclase [Planctomycetaceae bacterium]